MVVLDLEAVLEELAVFDQMMASGFGSFLGCLGRKIGWRVFLVQLEVLGRTVSLDFECENSQSHPEAFQSEVRYAQNPEVSPGLEPLVAS